MDFSDEDSDGWEALRLLANNVLFANVCEAKAHFLILWALRSYIPEIRMHFNESAFAGLMSGTMWLENTEAMDILLGASCCSNLIDALQERGGYTTLLQRIPEIYSGDQLPLILQRNPNLHHLGFDFDISLFLESPMSMSLYNCWTFASWRNTLIKSQVNIDDFVRQELEYSVMKDAGWKSATLLVLFDYDSKLSDDDPGNFFGHKCNWCRGREKVYYIDVQPHWVQIVERIKHGLDPVCGHAFNAETDKSSNEDDNMHDARLIWSESGTDKGFDESEASNTDYNIAIQFPNKYERGNDRNRSDPLKKDSDESSFIVSKSGILDCVYDRDMNVCIWCWEEYKRNGYKWTNHDNQGSFNGDDSIDEYSPYLFQS